MSDAQDIEAQAAEWLIRRDTLGSAQHQDLAAWLARDPRHRAAYLRLAAAWERTAHLKRLRPEGGAIDADLLSPRRRPKRAFRAWWSPLALAAGITVMVLSGILWFRGNREVQTYRTDVGGLARVVLGDGSAVTLNTDTELRVRLLPKRRELTLVRGEAQFAVAHDVTRPFEVSAGAHLVRAVGTTFDVRLDPDEVMQLIVTEGRVAVAEPSHIASTEAAPAATVAAGERAVAEAGQVTIHRVSSTEVVRMLSWKVGELSFQGETLKTAAEEFNRYNHRKLRIEDPAVAQLQVGGNFQTLDEDSFVAALERSFGVTARTSQDGSIILERPAASRP
jgi:transmembrane sensor